MAKNRSELKVYFNLFSAFLKTVS